MICTFFGHKDTPDDVLPALEQAIRKLIKENNDITFYVGTHGHFDGMVQRVLKKFAAEYPQMKYYVVLAYLPNSESDRIYYKDTPTVFPEGIENALPKYAISYRNNWMAQQADIVICYIRHNYGGAAQFVEYAKRRGKEIINIFE